MLAKPNKRKSTARSSRENWKVHRQK